MEQWNRIVNPLALFFIEGTTRVLNLVFLLSLQVLTSRMSPSRGVLSRHLLESVLQTLSLPSPARVNLRAEC